MSATCFQEKSFISKWDVYKYLVQSTKWSTITVLHFELKPFSFHILINMKVDSKQYWCLDVTWGWVWDDNAQYSRQPTMSWLGRGLRVGEERRQFVLICLLWTMRLCVRGGYLPYCVLLYSTICVHLQKSHANMYTLVYADPRCSSSRVMAVVCIIFGISLLRNSWKFREFGRRLLPLSYLFI